MKKMIAVGVVLSFLLILISGCSRSGTTASASNSGANAANNRASTASNSVDVHLQGTSFDQTSVTIPKGGTVNFFGGCPAGTSISLDTALIHYSNLTLLASFHHTPATIRRALELIESRLVRASDFIDGECGLSTLPTLFKSMANGNRAVKTMVDVRG